MIANIAPQSHIQIADDSSYDDIVHSLNAIVEEFDVLDQSSSAPSSDSSNGSSLSKTFTKVSKEGLVIEQGRAKPLRSSSEHVDFSVRKHLLEEDDTSCSLSTRDDEDLIQASSPLISKEMNRVMSSKSTAPKSWMFARRSDDELIAEITGWDSSFKQFSEQVPQGPKSQASLLEGVLSKSERSTALSRPACFSKSERTPATNCFSISERAPATCFSISERAPAIFSSVSERSGVTYMDDIVSSSDHKQYDERALPGDMVQQNVLLERAMQSKQRGFLSRFLPVR